MNQEKIIISNPVGEKLTGILHDTGAKELVLLCHGLNSSKDVDLLVNLATSLSKAGLAVFRFDFSGNGESEGEFEFGNYTKEVEDLRSVLLYWLGKGREVKAIIGHSKAGSTVLLYASKYKEVYKIVNASGRCDLEAGLSVVLGEDYMEKIEAGFLDVKDKSGKIAFRVTKESLLQRLRTNLKEAVQIIPNNIRILSVHGSKDEIVSVDSAYQFDKLIANHTLRVIDGADHMYTKHERELAETIINFIMDNEETAAET